MQLNTLSSKTKNTKNAPVGRGGKRGKTSGRGGKGQTARAGHKIRPEVRDLIKKLPKRRGHGKNRAKTVNDERIVYAPINLMTLESHFKNGDIVSPTTLLAKGLVRRYRGRAPKVKILGSSQMTKALIISGCVISKGALATLVAAGGKINA